MIRQNRRSRRPGSIVPLVAFCLVGLLGFVALGVDIGMVAVARTQAQSIADTAAMTAARTLDGATSQDLQAPVTNAQNVAAANRILGNSVTKTDLTVTLGAYHYDPVKQIFTPQYPAMAPDIYNLASVTLTSSRPSAFARALGIGSLSVSASAEAAHRPRDVAVVFDFSGSMNNESDLWNNEGYLGSVNNSSNNVDTVFPQFGPYDPMFSPNAQLQCTINDPRVGSCNVSLAVEGVPAMVGDYYQSDRGSNPSQGAFSPAPSSVTVSTPGGDNYLNKLNTNTPAINWQEITGSSSTGFQGYSNFNGYTQGPGYWGMTFFLWPPDPNSNKDWRKKFFLKPGGQYPNFGGPVDDDRLLWDDNGRWQSSPPGNYVINYKAILDWIKSNAVQGQAGDGKPFPPKLRAGRILYYDQIPPDVPAAAYDHSNRNNDIPWTDQNQRFWKEYIDFVIGVWRDPYGNIQTPGNPACSMGPDFTCGSGGSGSISISGPDKKDPLGKVYIAATDNPQRPRHRLWFGPMTLIQFLSDTGLLPGTARDISLSVAKLGIAGVLQDIQDNHPNDQMALIPFSRPQFDNDPPNVGRFNQAIVALGRDYAGMTQALWFPPNSSTADVRPWDANGVQTPRANGDFNANTTTVHGLMLAYNQLSSNSTLAGTTYNGQAVGGLGRKGTQRIVIVETDGMANQNSVPASGFSNQGATNSYYRILPGDTVSGGGYSQSDLLRVVQAICNKADGTPGTAPGYSSNPGYPGYSTATKPVLVHTLAFGAIFEPTSQASETASAVSLLQQISQIGGTAFPSTSSDPANGYKWIIGDLDQRKTRLRQAFGKILSTGAVVALIK